MRSKEDLAKVGSMIFDLQNRLGPIWQELNTGDPVDVLAQELLDIAHDKIRGIVTLLGGVERLIDCGA